MTSKQFSREDLDRLSPAPSLELDFQSQAKNSNTNNNNNKSPLRTPSYNNENVQDVYKQSLQNQRNYNKIMQQQERSQDPVQN